MGVLNFDDIKAGNKYCIKNKHSSTPDKFYKIKVVKRFANSPRILYELFSNSENLYLKDQGQAYYDPKDNYITFYDLEDCYKAKKLSGGYKNKTKKNKNKNRKTLRRR